MKTTKLLLLITLLLAACEASPTVKRTGQALGTQYSPVLCDVIANDGQCCFREAVIAANTNAAYNNCPAPPAGHVSSDLDTITLPAGTLEVLISGIDAAAAQGDFDLTGPTQILGAGVGQTIIDMNRLDRGFHVSGSIDLELGGLTITGGCTNGLVNGICASQAANSAPTGGGFYFNSNGNLFAHDLELYDNWAGQGGGGAVCAGTSTPASALVQDVHVHNNVAQFGGGGLSSHVAWQLQDSEVDHNVSYSLAGGIEQFNGVAQLVDVSVHDNTADRSGGGLGAYGNSAATYASRIEMYGGSLVDNKAAVAGGNAWANASGSSSTFSKPCSAAGCSIALTNVTVSGGRADDPSSSPNGSGGNLSANPTGTTPGRIELRGTTAVVGGTDLSSPQAPDCEGLVQLYDSSDVANMTGCTIEDHRPPPGPVCGDNETEGDEDCDGGACCTEECTFAQSGAPCSDGDACTVDDECDALGACEVGVSSTCGDGTLQSACGEQCDDSNTDSQDGCSAVCLLEACTAWE